jgi:hypothetical protein
LAREVAAKKRRGGVEEIGRMREEARVRREEARVKREEASVKREEDKVKEEESDSSEFHDGIVAISEQEQGSYVDDVISEAKTEEKGKNANDYDCEL